MICDFEKAEILKVEISKLMTKIILSNLQTQLKIKNELEC